MSLVREYPRILSDYFRIAQELAGEGLDILKTDAYNETESLPIPGGIARNIPGRVQIIELDSSRCRQALRMGFVVTHADIRQIPFEDGSFDLILDFSTIDHVGDYQVVLKEYARLLRPNGTASIVFWTKPVGDLDKDGQYYFTHDEFMADITTIFQTGRIETLFREDGRQLTLFIGGKRE